MCCSQQQDQHSITLVKSNEVSDTDHVIYILQSPIAEEAKQIFNNHNNNNYDNTCRYC